MTELTEDDIEELRQFIIIQGIRKENHKVCRILKRTDTILQALALEKRVRDRIRQLKEILKTESGRGYMDRDVVLLQQLLGDKT